MGIVIVLKMVRNLTNGEDDGDDDDDGDGDDDDNLDNVFGVLCSKTIVKACIDRDT